MQKIPRVSFFFFQAFFYTLPFSVTLSQGMCILSIFFSLPSLWENQDWIKKILLPFFFLLLFYLGGLPYIGSEVKDCWMLLIIPTSLIHAKINPERIQRTVRHTFWIFLLTGFVSLIFPYRLSTFVMDGFLYIPGRRLPHQISEIMGLPIQLPIGFQNTHLTYGGLLTMFWFHQFFSLKKSYIFLFLGILLILFNQARSIWIGFLIVVFVSSYWNKKSQIRSWKLLLMSLGLSFVLFFLWNESWIFQRTVSSVFQFSSLENQRFLLHWGNAKLLQQAFPFGLGSGNYTSNHLETFLKPIESKPYMYYLVSILPRSHAHNDFLHAYLQGGLTSLLGLVGFWVFFWKNTFDKNFSCFFGGGFLVISGLFQCFLLDDEIVLPFYAFVGMAFSNLEPNQKPSKINLAIAMSLVIGIVFLVFLPIVYYFSNQSLDKAFQHRAKDWENRPIPQLLDSGISIWKGDKVLRWKLEGCLSYNYRLDGAHSDRTKPVQFAIEFPSNDDGVYPETLVTFFTRESIDQDKEYRLQKETFGTTKKKVFPRGGRTVLKWEGQIPQAKDKLFLDFGIEYIWPSEGVSLLPQVTIQKNCD